MAAAIINMNMLRTLNNVTKLFTNSSVSLGTISDSIRSFKPRVSICQCAFLHVTPQRSDLMEFFDNTKNWGETNIRVGRSWKVEELRIKSNEDLHKLWYVLLKERNMLLTMEEACKQAYQLFPNPERIDKVEESMENLESVVRERNHAYHLLETGETGERPAIYITNQIGLRYLYRKCEHRIPRFMNRRWKETHKFGWKDKSVPEFLKLYREKIWNTRRRTKNRERNQAFDIMKRFPNVDLEALKERFPTIDTESLKQKVDSHIYFPSE